MHVIWSTAVTTMHPSWSSTFVFHFFFHHSFVGAQKWLTIVLQWELQVISLVTGFIAEVLLVLFFVCNGLYDWNIAKNDTK